VNYFAFLLCVLIGVMPIRGLASPIEGNTNTIANAPQKQIVLMGIQGQISKQVLERVRQSIGRVQGDPIPAGLIVLLDSPGGDGNAAMAIGRLLRAANAHVFVTGQCASACIFLLASGVVRSAAAYSVGIHRGRITISDANAKVIQEVNIEENPKAKAALLQFEDLALNYFQEMGMSDALFPLMQAHQLKGVYRMSHAQIVKMGLSGFEKAYFDSRAAFYEGQQGPYKMNADEYERRTMRVASRCGAFDKHHQEFIRCYQETLREPFAH
jgi:ATP-dependent protease ClpP protease subunit